MFVFVGIDLGSESHQGSETYPTSQAGEHSEEPNAERRCGA
jgi:hypothetical protein